jgi:ribosomal protein S6
MEKPNSSYETVFITDLSLGDDAVAGLVKKFTTLIAENGTITETSEWGKRKLAYPINDLNEGYYTLVKFSSHGDFPAELDRIFQITDGIMRSIIVKLDA